MEILQKQTLELTRAGSFYIFWTKAQQIYEKLTGQTNLGFGAQLVKNHLNRVWACGSKFRKKCGLFTQVSLPEFSVSDIKSVLQPTETGATPFTGEVYFLFSGRQEGQNVHLALAIY